MKQDTPNDGTDAVRLRAVLQCEPPNPDLHTFLGKLTYHSNSGLTQLLLANTTQAISLTPRAITTLIFSSHGSPAGEWRIVDSSLPENLTASG